MQRCVTRRQRKTPAVLRVESSQARYGQLFWRLPLWPAPWCQPPTPPHHHHHWLCRAASPSEDVMSGPGWQESWPGGATSLWSVSLPFIPLPFPVFLFFLFLFLSFTPPPLQPHLVLLFSIYFPLNLFDSCPFCPFHLYPQTYSFHLFVFNPLAFCLCIHHTRLPGQTCEIPSKELEQIVFP